MLKERALKKQNMIFDSDASHLPSNDVCCLYKKVVHMVWTCEEEVCRCTSKEVWEVAIIGFSIGRASLEKSWGEVLRHDMTSSAYRRHGLR